MPPLWFFVDRFIGDAAQLLHGPAPELHYARRELRARRLIHKRHKFIGEARHGAADADAAHVRTAADAIHPAALRHVAVHNRPPAAQFHQALRRTVLSGERPLLVITATVAAFMDGLAEQPGWS